MSSSTGNVEANASSRDLRKSNREKKKAEHFGHSDQSANLEASVSRLRIQLLLETLFELCDSDPFQTEPSLIVKLQLPAKRKAATQDEEEESKPSTTEIGAPKRRRIAPKATATKAELKKKAVQAENDSRPAPRESPEVWAEVHHIF